MEILSYIFVFYFIIVALIWCRFGWYIISKLDRYDWKYSRSDIISSFFFWSILWPLIFLKLQVLITPEIVLKGGYVSQQARLWYNPPPCGEFVLYRQGNEEVNDEIVGEFTFNSKDIEQVLIQKIQHYPNLTYDEEGAILNWLRNRNESISTPIKVPVEWKRFKYVAHDMIRSGFGEIHCLKCKKTISMSQLLAKNPDVNPNSYFKTLVCQNDHNLLDIDGIRF